MIEKNFAMLHFAIFTVLDKFWFCLKALENPKCSSETISRTIPRIDLTDYSFLPNSLVSILTNFSMSCSDKGYLPIFSYTKLFLVDLRPDNKFVSVVLRSKLEKLFCMKTRPLCKKVNNW